MGCEFSDKVREAKKNIVLEAYEQLKPEHQKKFDAKYGHPSGMQEQSTWMAYYHCKRVLRSREYIKNR